MSDKETSPLDLLGDIERERIEKAKEEGSPVFMTKINEETFFYKGLLRKDFGRMKIEGMRQAREMLGEIKDPESLSEEARELLQSKMESLEDDFLLVYSILCPRLSLEDVQEMPAGRVSTLRSLIYAASGDADEVSEPVKV